MLQTLQVLKRNLAVDIVLFSELLDTLPLPSDCADAQIGIGLILVLVEAMLLFDALDAIVVRADHASRRAASIRRLPCGELFDDASEDIDFQLRLALAGRFLAFAHFLRRDEGHNERRHKQGAYDNAAPKEDDQITLREPSAIHEIRDGEQDRKRDGSLSARKGRDEALAKVELEFLTMLLTASARVEPVARADPRESNNIEKQRKRDNITDEREVAEGDIIPRMNHGLRQLCAQKHEHKAVQGEGEHTPHARRHDVHARDGRSDRMRGDHVDEARNNNGDNAAHVNGIGNRIHQKRNEDFKEYMKRRVLNTKRARLIDEELADIGEKRTDRDTAEKLNEEIPRRIEKGERPRHRGGNGELERHDAARIV